MTEVPESPRVSMIGNAHIDPVWIWDWHEGMYEVLATFGSALDRLDEDPDLVFSASSSAFYEWVEHVDPVMFARIRDAVAARRWALVGGEWVEPDCNLPSGEAVCRQFLYGQRYLVSRFGTAASVGWNVDSFGHAASLPQILVAAGLRGYVMMRPDEKEKEIPSPLFRWVGCDGTPIPTYRVPFEYGTDIFGEDVLLRERSTSLRARADALGLPLMCFFGVGNHGGGPTRLALATIRQLTKESGGDVRMDSPDAYFDRNAQRALPEVSGDLQWHAVGCYSARVRTKQANARAEHALVVAEKLQNMCIALTGRGVRGSRSLGRAWRGLLFSQFHDALGGTCTERSHEGIDLLVAEARAVADRVSTRALQTLAQSIDTWTEGADRAESLQASAFAGLPIPLIVCNPLSWPSAMTVSIPYPIAACTDAAGAPHSVQKVASGEVTFSPAGTMVQVPVPAFGYKRFWLHVARVPPGCAPEGRTDAHHDVATSAYILGNGELEVHVDDASGRGRRLVDLRTGTQWMSEEGLRCVVIPDDSDTWSHGVTRYDGDEEEWTCERVEIVEEGPVRATVRARFRYGDSLLSQQISLYRQLPFVDLRLSLQWHERHKVIKLVVPFALHHPACVAGAPYGAAERSVTGHEDPMVHWVDLSGSNGEGGITCTTVGTYGYDALESRLRLTLARSPRAADHGRGWGSDDPDGYPYLDQGSHRFHVRLHPHHGSWQDGCAVEWSEQHLLDPPFVIGTWQRAPLGPQASVIDVRQGSVAVTAMKRAESAPGAVMRICEVAGRATSAEVAVSGRPAWTASMGPHEIQTVFVPDDVSAPMREIDLCELALDAAQPR